MDTATHGFKQEVEIEDPNSPGTFIDVTEKVHNVGPAFDRDAIETSTFGQGDKTSINGMRGATFSMDYYSDQDLRDLLWDIFMSDDPVRVNYYPEGNVTGKEKQQAYFNMGNFGDGGNTSSAVGGAASFTRTGATTRTVVA